MSAWRHLAKSLLKRLEAADGDPIEALRGHVCGPACWHNQDPAHFITLLRPCPFCGGSAQIEGSKPGEKAQFWAICLGCAATGPWRKTEEGARDAWNKRTR